MRGQQRAAELSLLFMMRHLIASISPYHAGCAGCERSQGESEKKERKIPINPIYRTDDRQKRTAERN